MTKGTPEWKAEWFVVCKADVLALMDNPFIRDSAEIKAFCDEHGVDVGVGRDMWRNGKDIGSKEEVHKQLNDFLDLFPEFTFAHVKEAKRDLMLIVGKKVI